MHTYADIHIYTYIHTQTFSHLHLNNLLEVRVEQLLQGVIVLILQQGYSDVMFTRCSKVTEKDKTNKNALQNMEYHLKKYHSGDPKILIHLNIK